MRRNVEIKKNIHQNSSSENKEQPETGGNDYQRNKPVPGRETTGGTRKGGGGSGYDVNREQQEVNRQREKMHEERDPDRLHPERTSQPTPGQPKQPDPITTPEPPPERESEPQSP